MPVEALEAPRTAMMVGSLLPPDAVLGTRVLVCGGRDYANWQRLAAVLDEMHLRVPIALLIEGDARGADRLAARWARRRNIPLLPVPADWDGLARAAGSRRNLKMLAVGRPDVVVAFPGDVGTRNMLKQAKICGYDCIDLRYEMYGWAGSP